MLNDWKKHEALFEGIPTVQCSREREEMAHYELVCKRQRIMQINLIIFATKAFLSCGLTEGYPTTIQAAIRDNIRQPNGGGGGGGGQQHPNPKKK
jgi:hypothetical protein